MAIKPTAGAHVTAPITAPVQPVAVTLAARLQRFNLEPANVQTNNLAVAANQTVVLDSADPTYAKQIVKLTPQNIDDLKNWIGVPDTAFANTPAPGPLPMTVLPIETTYTTAQSMDMRALASSYIFGHSASISPAQIPALNAWIKSSAAYIIVILFENITVASGARLVVNKSITTLFANDITIDKGGVIQLKNSTSGINCASIKGL